MILIELASGGPAGVHLVFHPRVTVIRGIDARRRHDLVVRLQRTMAGASTGMRVSVDLGSGPEELTVEVVDLLALMGRRVDNVLRTADLPGAIVLGSADENRELVDAQRLVRDRAAALASARHEDRTRRDQKIEQFEENLRNALGHAEELRKTVSGEKAKVTPAAERESRVAQLRDVLGMVEVRTVELTAMIEAAPGATDDVRRGLQAIATLEETDTGAPPLNETARELRATWRSLTEELTALERKGRPPQWLVDQAQSELDETAARVRALAYQASEGANVEEGLARSRKQLRDAQAVWGEVTHGAEARISALQEKRQDLRSEAAALLGTHVDNDTIDSALSARISDAMTMREATDLIVDALRRVGIETSDPTDMELLKTEGRAWLRSQRGAKDRRKLQTDLASAVFDRRDVLREIAEVEAMDDSAEQKDDTEDATWMRGELAQAERRVDELTQTVEELKAAPEAPEVHALQQEHDVALAALNDLRKARSGVNAAGDGANQRPWWLQRSEPTPASHLQAGPGAEVDVSGVMEEADDYVLSRAAALRVVARGESVPLIIDSAFDDLPEEQTRRLLDQLSRASSVVQVVYFTQSRNPWNWALDQRPELAGTFEPPKF